MLFSNATVAQLIASVVGLLVAFTIHEACHALIADRLGDPTAKRAGRLSLNPVAHLDPLGTLMILVSGFGWGKPVPVNPYNLRRPGGRLGMGLVAAAGPLSNLLTAYVFAVPIRAQLITNYSSSNIWFPSIGVVLVTIVQLNVLLAVFNLLPIAPLDGFKVALGVLPPRWAYRWAQTERYGPLILLFLILFGRMGSFDLLGATLTPLANGILRLIVT